MSQASSIWENYFHISSNPISLGRSCFYISIHLISFRQSYFYFFNQYNLSWAISLYDSIHPIFHKKIGVFLSLSYFLFLEMSKRVLYFFYFYFLSFGYFPHLFYVSYFITFLFQFYVILILIPFLFYLFSFPFGLAQTL